MAAKTGSGHGPIWPVVIGEQHGRPPEELFVTGDDYLEAEAHSPVHSTHHGNPAHASTRPPRPETPRW